MSSKKILVVDDDKVFLRILDERLSSAGYAVAFASNGKEAVSMAKERQPDLIILDVMMPEMDGAETAKTLENDPSTKDIPIIFITALLSKEDEEKRGFISGRTSFAKPVDIDLLLREIHKILEAQAP